MNLEELGITKEQLLEMVATKIADQHCDDSGDIENRVEKVIQQRIREAFEKGLSIRIDNFLQTEMERLINQQITPVTIWGEKCGAPTTIRDCLAERAQKFWEVKVDKDGRECSYNGTPRFERMMKEIVNDEFTKAVRNNVDLILGEFKKAVKDDAIKLVAKHIDNLVKTP